MDNISVVGVEYRPIAIEDYSSLMSGDIIWTPKSNMLDCIAYLIVDNQSKERPYSLINMVGYKAGLRLVSLPNECVVSGNSKGLSFFWIRDNWDKWIALGKFEDAVFLRYTTLLE